MLDNWPNGLKEATCEIVRAGSLIWRQTPNHVPYLIL
jgi:hypothetical protein